MIETTAAHFPVLNLFQHLLLFLTHFFWISILPAEHSFAVVRNVILLSVLVGCFLFFIWLWASNEQWQTDETNHVIHTPKQRIKKKKKNSREQCHLLATHYLNIRFDWHPFGDGFFMTSATATATSTTKRFLCLIISF